MFKSAASTAPKARNDGIEHEKGMLGLPKSGTLPYTHSKLQSDAAMGIVSMRPIVPNYSLALHVHKNTSPVLHTIHNTMYKPRRTDPRSSIDELELQTTSPILKNLLKRKQIKIASRQRFGKDIEILNSRKSLILLRVVPNTIMNADKFEFTFDLLFGPHVNVSGNNNDEDNENKHPDDDQPELERQRPSFSTFDVGNFSKVYYYYELNVSHKQLKLIHDTTVKEMSEGKEYFARKHYPSPHKNTKTKRDEEIHEEMSEENRYLLLPNLPKGKGMFHKKASWEDCQNFALYLEKLFSSSPLCVQDYIYHILVIDPHLKKLIQHKAGTRLRTLRNIAEQDFIKNPFKLTKKKGPDYHFHTLYITQRPLRITTSNFSLVNFDHWALKFEGNKNLLTVEFFDDAASDHGIVKIRLIPNTRLNRRAFCWWERDDLQQYHQYNEKYGKYPSLKPQPQFFTKRWETIWKVWLKRITAECVGKLIMRWLQTNDYAVYNVAKNNCQHFVRDITASLDISAAKKLNSLFDHKVIAAVLPAVAVADGMTEEVRMYEIRDILIDEMNKYNQKKKKQMEKQLKLRQLEQSVSMPHPSNGQMLRSGKPHSRSAAVFVPNRVGGVNNTISRPKPGKLAQSNPARGLSKRPDAFQQNGIPPPPALPSDEQKGKNAPFTDARQRQRSRVVFGAEENETEDEDEAKMSLLVEDAKYITDPGPMDVNNFECTDHAPDFGMETEEEEKQDAYPGGTTYNAAPDLSELVEETGLDINKFMQVDAFFVQEDKDKIVDHINEAQYDDKWEEHFEIVREYVNLPDNDDPEKILEEINSPQNTRLLQQFSHKTDANEFIKVLVAAFHGFSLDDDSDDDNCNAPMLVFEQPAAPIQEKVPTAPVPKQAESPSEKEESKSDDEKYIHHSKAESSEVEDFHDFEENHSHVTPATLDKMDTTLARCELDKLYCDGSCGNTLSHYINSLQIGSNSNNKRRRRMSMSGTDKISTIARCFMSYDYELRVELISLMEQSTSNSSPRHVEENLFTEMLLALKNEEEYFQIDASEWVKKFDRLFTEFLKTNKAFILDALCLKACKRNFVNMGLLEEFQQNSNSPRQVDMKQIGAVKQTSQYKQLIEKGYTLKNDELIALHSFIKYQHEFVKEKINSCKWKQFYTNLVRAVKIVHEGLVFQGNQFPSKLYCCTGQVEMDRSTLTINSATYWTTKPRSQQPDRKLLELNDVKEFLFHRDKTKCAIIGIPVNWVIGLDKIQADGTLYSELWVLMPFVAASVSTMEKKGYDALFNVDKNNTNSLSILNSKYWR